MARAVIGWSRKKEAWFSGSPGSPAFQRLTLIGWFSQGGVACACPAPLACPGSSRPPALRQRSGAGAALYGSGPGGSRGGFGGSRGGFGGSRAGFGGIRGGSVNPEAPSPCPFFIPHHERFKGAPRLRADFTTVSRASGALYGSAADGAAWGFLGGSRRFFWGSRVVFGVPGGVWGPCPPPGCRWPCNGRSPRSPPGAGPLRAAW